MVSAHTERLLKGSLWTLGAQTMTRASQGAWWECDGSAVGGKTKPLRRKKKEDGGFFIMLKSVKYFDMSHTPWCSSSWAFCLSAGKQLTFFAIKSFASPPPGKNLSWGAMACRCSCSAGVLPMDTGDKNSLRKPLQLCGLAGFSFFPPSHPKLGPQETFWLLFFFFVGRFDLFFFLPFLSLLVTMINRCNDQLCQLVFFRCHWLCFTAAALQKIKIIRSWINTSVTYPPLRSKTSVRLKTCCANEGEIISLRLNQEWFVDNLRYIREKSYITNSYTSYKNEHSYFTPKYDIFWT